MLIKGEAALLLERQGFFASNAAFIFILNTLYHFVN